MVGREANWGTQDWKGSREERKKTVPQASHGDDNTSDWVRETDAVCGTGRVCRDGSSGITKVQCSLPISPSLVSQRQLTLYMSTSKGDKTASNNRRGSRLLLLKQISTTPAYIYNTHTHSYIKYVVHIDKSENKLMAVVGTSGVLII